MSAIAGSYVGMVMSVGASVGTQVDEIKADAVGKRPQGDTAVVRYATVERKVPGAWRWVFGVSPRSALVYYG